jgi:predicted nucleic acid-binding protein
MKKYLIDTNIVIYYFNGIIVDEVIHTILEQSFNISIISKIEFLSWQKLLNNKELRQKYKIKTPDAIIGATALVHDFEIVTNNADDFKQLDLKIITPKVKE